MRLLALEINGELSLTEFYGNNTPPYAILSHTWGEEGEEVTFKDIIEDTVKSKAGYNKIRFCGEQAVKDNLKYFWVDTCCIDKSSSSELLEAINSMFTWYRNATKCYVYLSDVSTCDYKENNHLSRSKWELSFRHSRWFTRGWTLQELIAPASVEFFSLEGERFGDKKLLERQVHDITGIPLKALQGIPLSSFSVPERMSWAAKRETKREEDRAYSLLGIYNIYMPLLYGEGSENAFIRLHEEIDKRSRKGEGQPNMPQPDPAFKAIQELLIDRKKRKEERIQSEARKAAEAARQAQATANNAAKLMAAEEKRWENEIAKKVRQAIEITKLDAEKEAAKKASEEIEEYEKKLEEAEKMIADLLVAKKKFEDEAKALRPKDDMLKPPIRFKDAVGRKFSYPWHICKTWKVRYFEMH
jgi:hypothetical protein